MGKLQIAVKQLKNHNRIVNNADGNYGKDCGFSLNLRPVIVTNL
jgi:hypothetical protein